MRATLLSVVIFLIGATTFAQDKYGNTPEEQTKCKESLSLYREFRDQDLIMDAMPHWRKACAICPKSAKTLYTDGVDFYRTLLKSEKDDTIKALIADSLFMVYDARIANFGQEGFVLGRKGVDMIRYAGEKPMMAVETLRKSIEIQGNKAEAGVLSSYYIALFKALGAGQTTKDVLLTEYLVISEIADYNIANSEKEKTISYYEKAKNNFDELFVKVAECSDVVEVVKTKYSESPDDKEVLSKCVRILSKRDCLEDPIYFTVASKLQSIEPSVDAARGLGLYALKNKKYNDAVKFYDQAIKLNEGNTGKADDLYRLAQAYFGAGNYSSCKSFAAKAAAAKSGWGEPYILIGDAITYGAKSCGENEMENKAVNWLSYDYYVKAKSIDASVAADANKRAANAKANWPSKTILFNYSMVDKVNQDITIACWLNETTKIRLAE
ncbi:MAG: tetratricopeptide (TPR) repeat protein [Flavobacteriales bacterium]|jgi:tetratricopeptide (TPR) repeat protein